MLRKWDISALSKVTLVASEGKYLRGVQKDHGISFETVKWLSFLTVAQYLSNRIQSKLDRKQYY